MKKHTIFSMKLGLFASLALLHTAAWATCTNTHVSQTEDNKSALIEFGSINLNAGSPGELIASTVTQPTNFIAGGATGDSILWECDKSDIESIHFLVATNGDDRVGGFYDIGESDKLTGVYATWFAHVGLKQTMWGETLSRTWKRIPVTSYATTDSKIQIRLKDIPPLQAELYRVSALPGTDAKSSYCGNNNDDGSGIAFASMKGVVYSCTQPNAYIQLSGTSAAIPFGHDQEGEDSATHFAFWEADNGFGYGMRSANTLYLSETQSQCCCCSRNTTNDK